MDMLENFANPQLGNLQPISMFLLYGAPPYLRQFVRNWFYKNFLNRLTGRGGPIPWRLSPRVRCEVTRHYSMQCFGWLWWRGWGGVDEIDFFSRC